MIKDKRIIAIIPARGRSKRIPQKNIKLLAGKPLIAYTIDAAFKSRYLGRVLVTTEDKKIAEIARKYNAEVINRPKRLASDKTKMIDVVRQAINFLEKKGYQPKLIILLLPTVPLRTAADIDRTIEIFINGKGNAAMSVCRHNPLSYWSLKLENGYLKPLFGYGYFQIGGQDLPPIFIHNGAVFVATPKLIKKYKTFYPPKLLAYQMPLERSIDIDEKEDFERAEKMIKSLKNKSPHN